MSLDNSNSREAMVVWTAAQELPSAPVPNLIIPSFLRDDKSNRSPFASTSEEQEQQPTKYRGENKNKDLTLRRPQNSVLHQRRFNFSIDPILRSMDAFNNLGALHNPETGRVLDHWVNGFQKTRTPMSPRPAWLRTSVEDPTLLAATIACSGSHLLFLQGMTTPTPTFISQKLKAIQAINRKLRTPESAVSDYTIISVAVMALLECLSGSPAACAIHRRGLETLVKSRGGLRRLGLGGITQRTASWADTCCAIVLRSRPKLHPELIADRGENVHTSVFISHDSDLTIRLLPLAESPDLGRRIANIWSRLLQLSEFLISIPPGDTSSLDDALFSDKLDSIERETLHILNSSTLAKSPGVAFLKAFLNAALIYVYQELREIPKFSAVCVAVAGRIHSGLQMIDLSPVVEAAHDLLLWTVLLGKSAAQVGTSDRGWFNETLRELSSWLAIRMPDDLEGLEYFDFAGQSMVWSRRGSMEGTALEEMGSRDTHMYR